MALDSRAQPHTNKFNNAPFYAFGGSSSSSTHHPDLAFHRIDKSSSSSYMKLHQQGRMNMAGGVGKILSDTNDGSLISFEDSYEAAAGCHGFELNSEMHHAEYLSNSHHQNASHLKGKVDSRDDMLDWFYSSDVADDQTAVHKHPNLDESSMPPNKKQCTSTAKKTSKAKQPVASKDPQSIAAKNRRERISERLKKLQELVPNGTKVDLVTMLEKAIGYVKFLQLQVKVLAADEFWPVQGGKAPELAQVKDAIDAILLSQRSDRNSASD